jgi:hypothetical protein
MVGRDTARVEWGRCDRVEDLNGGCILRPLGCIELFAQWHSVTGFAETCDGARFLLVSSCWLSSN